MSRKPSYSGTYLQKLHESFQRTKKRGYQWLLEKKVSSILDVGCGVGLDVLKFSEFVEKVVGIDNDEGFLKDARQNIGQANNISLIKGTVYDLPFTPEHIQAVWIDRVFQHLEYKENALQQISTVLQSQGFLHIIDTDYGSVRLFMKDIELEKTLISYMAKEKFPFAKGLNPLKSLLREHQFKIVDSGFDTYTFEGDEQVNEVFRFDKFLNELRASGKIETFQKPNQLEMNLFWIRAIKV